MARSTKDAFERILEDNIDANGLTSVIESLSTVCYGKAEHIAENWQDERAALIDNLADKLPEEVG